MPKVQIRIAARVKASSLRDKCRIKPRDVCRLIVHLSRECSYLRNHAVHYNRSLGRGKLRGRARGRDSAVAVQLTPHFCANRSVSRSRSRCGITTRTMSRHFCGFCAASNSKRCVAGRHA